MTTVLNYFETDFPDAAAKRYELGFNATDGSGSLASMIARAHIDFTAHVLFASFYLPRTDRVDLVARCDGALGCRDYIFDFKGAGEFRLPGSESMLGAGIRIRRNDPLLEVQLLPLEGGIFDARQFGVAPVTYIYTDESVSKAEQEAIDKLGIKHGTTVRLRGPNYAVERARLDGPKAFISHDSRDGAIAREIAFGLLQLGEPVWFSEFALKPGDRLRQSIEKGIKECKRCIVLLTQNYISNTGWAATEFDSIFTREIHERKSLVVPVWADITAEQVYAYSPALKNVFAATWDEKDIKESVRKICMGLRDDRD